MQRAVWITCCWPGLAQLWLRGRWRGLAVAAVFALLVNAGLAATFIWPEWWPAGWCQALWWGLGATWCFTVIQSGRLVASWNHAAKINKETTLPRDQQEDFFVQAQAEYLQQNWFEAEQWLGKAIDANDHDVDSHLMLIALCRHTGRHAEAQQLLKHVRTLEPSDKWNWELQREQELLDSFNNHTAEENSLLSTEISGGPHPLHHAA